jgi:biopolymer transport protein ExbD
MRRRFARRAPRKPTELLLVPMIDIFTVLVTFLLMTAVFSRITIIELDLQSAAAGGIAAPEFRLEVIVRKRGIELSNGKALIAAIPNVNGSYDLKTLAELAMALKRDYPDTDDASVLLEPEIAYDHLIQVMDAIRSAEAPADSAIELSLAQARESRPTNARPPRLALFTDIAVGDAP